MLADEGEHAHVLVGIELAWLVRLHDEDAERFVAGTERDPEPVLAVGADLLNLPLGNQALEPVVRHVLRQARAQDERRQSSRPAAPERLP